MSSQEAEPSDALLQWINTHDCGVTPTAIRTLDGKIEIRVSGVGTGKDSEFVERTVVASYTEARDALGY